MHCHIESHHEGPGSTVSQPKAAFVRSVPVCCVGPNLTLGSVTMAGFKGILFGPSITFHQNVVEF
jgi:hypothetical protein